MLQIDLAATTPAYEQIASGLRTLLVGGTLQPGSQLPTVRQLALDLGVHHNTVAEAYRQLAAEGWLELRRGRGAMVIERPSPVAAPAEPARFERQLDQLIARSIAAGMSRHSLAAMLRHSATRLEGART